MSLPLPTERLETSNGSSLAAGAWRAAYEAWCAKHDHKPLSMPKPSKTDSHKSPALLSRK